MAIDLWSYRYNLGTGSASMAHTALLMFINTRLGANGLFNPWTLLKLPTRVLTIEMMTLVRWANT